MRSTVQERVCTELRMGKLEIWIQRERGQLSVLEVHSELMEEICGAQSSCLETQSLREQISRGRLTELSEREGRMLIFQYRMVVPAVHNLR